MDKEDVIYIFHSRMEHYSVIRNNKILPFVATWMNMEGIMLSEISQRKTNTVRYHLYVKSEKYKKSVNITKNKHSHRYREETRHYQWGEEMGRGYRGRGLRDTDY